MTAERISPLEAEALAGAGLAPAIERLQKAYERDSWGACVLERPFTRSLIDLLTRCRDTLEAQSELIAKLQGEAK